MVVGRVTDHRGRRLQGRDGQGQHAPERCGVDSHGCRRQAAPGEDLRQQPAEGVADDRRLLGQASDDLVEVVGDLPHRLVGEHLGMGLGLLDGGRVVRPAGRERDVAGLLEQRRPAIPTARQQPQAVNEDHRRESTLVRARHLLGFVTGDRQHPPVAVRVGEA